MIPLVNRPNERNIVEHGLRSLLLVLEATEFDHFLQCELPCLRLVLVVCGHGLGEGKGLGVVEGSDYS